MMAKLLVFFMGAGAGFASLTRADRWLARRRLLKRTSASGTLKAPAGLNLDSGPFALALALGRMAAPRKKEEISAVSAVLARAGFRKPEHLPLFYGIRISLGAFFAFFSLVAILTFGRPTPQTAVLLFVPFAMGYYLPRAALAQRVRHRRLRIFRELPDTLDLLTVCLKAGLSFDTALYRVCRELSNIAPVLSAEFALFFLEIRGGIEREQALTHLYQRNPSDELKNVAAVIAQSARSGTDIAGALKTYTENMRTERRQKAEEEAGKLSTKMTLPLVLFILPALILIILGPTIINYINLVKDGF